MGVKGFRRLSRALQLELIMVSGILLVECRRLNMIMRLFHFYTFYVEVYSQPENNDIIMINAFDDTSQLDHYLLEIDISPLVS